jgi:hypothetical protein
MVEGLFHDGVPHRAIVPNKFGPSSSCGAECPEIVELVVLFGRTRAVNVLATKYYKLPSHTPPVVAVCRLGRWSGWGASGRRRGGADKGGRMKVAGGRAVRRRLLNLLPLLCEKAVAPQVVERWAAQVFTRAPSEHYQSVGGGIEDHGGVVPGSGKGTSPGWCWRPTTPQRCGGISVGVREEPKVVVVVVAASAEILKRNSSRQNSNTNQPWHT